MVLSGSTVSLDVRRYAVYHYDTITIITGKSQLEVCRGCDLPSIKACEVPGWKSATLVMPLPLGRFAPDKWKQNQLANCLCHCLLPTCIAFYWYFSGRNVITTSFVLFFRAGFRVKSGMIGPMKPKEATKEPFVWFESPRRIKGLSMFIDVYACASCFQFFLIEIGWNLPFPNIYQSYHNFDFPLAQLAPSWMLNRGRKRTNEVISLIKDSEHLLVNEAWGKKRWNAETVNTSLNTV